MTTASGEFVNFQEVPHVADSEHPFAAIVSAASGFTVEAVQRTLDGANRPQPDATLGKLCLENKYRTVTVAPVNLRGAIGPEGILGRIEDELAEGNPVALYHGADPSPENPQTWALLAGHEAGDAEAKDRLLEIITDSTVPEESPGIFAWTVNTEYVHHPLTTVYVDEDEPKSAGKSSSTGQDKVVWPAKGDSAPDASA